MKFLICGHYGAQNIGDELILKGLKSLLKNIDKNNKITVLREDKNTKKFPAGIKSLIKFFKTKDKTNIKALKECDYFILGGGGLFGSLRKKANIIWSIQALFAILYKKPILHIGQSFGKNTNFIEKYFIKKIFQKSKLIILRDEESKNNLKKLGITQKIYVFPDLALYNKTIKAKESERKNIIIVLRQLKNLNDDFKTKIIDFIKFIDQRKDGKILLVNFVKTKGSDEALHKEIIKKSKLKNLKIINGYEKNIFDTFNSAKFVLGMRLHSIITSLKTETPFIGISYAEKVNTFAKYANVEKYTINYKQIDTDVLKTMYSKIIEDKDTFKKSMNEFNKKNIVKFKKLEDLIKQLD